MPASRFRVTASPRSALVVAFLLAVLSGAPAASQERYQSDDYRAVGRALVCMCGGCNALVHECAMDRCPSSNPIREEIAERLQAGDAPEAIIGRFRDRYGLAVLAAPPTRGFHLSAWLVPGVFLLGGAVVAVALMRRWRKQSGDAPAETAGPDPAMAARLERDIAGIR